MGADPRRLRRHDARLARVFIDLLSKCYNSVRVTDEFMNAAINDENFFTRSVKEKKPFASKKAKDLLRKIAEATYYCGDPGMQYDTTINKWHTTKNTARIYDSNHCTDFIYL